MTNAEFDILDELYFLQPYDYLKKTLNLTNEELKSTLQVLLEKKWVRCYRTPTEEIDFDRLEFEKDFWNYHYLASKEGLLAHNSNF